MIRTFLAMRNVDPASPIPNPPGHAYRNSRDAGARFHASGAYSEQHSGQAGRDSRRFVRWLRRIRSMSGAEPSWDEILIEARSTRATILHAPLQLRIARVLHTAGTRLVAGRDFTWAEIYNVRQIGIISESLARELWGSPRRPSANASVNFPANLGMK